MVEPSELLVLGGRSGVGKSTVAFEVSAQLAALRIAHAVVEGDLLDLAYPPPPTDDRLAERNLAAMWANYRAGGYHRLVYTNTVSVLYVDRIVSAMGGPVRVTSVLLACSDATCGERLARREVGSTLAEHVERSKRAAVLLERSAPSEVVTIDTDARSVIEVASEVISRAGWAASGHR